MLYIVDENGCIIKRKDAEQFGIPLFRWLVKDERGWSFMATLRYLNPETLMAWYRGPIQFLRRGRAFAIEFWLGEHGLAILFPSLQILALGPEHDR